MVGSLEEARRRYAEELRFTARVTALAVVEAFASVPRERFLGPGPWRILSPMATAEYWTTEDADPRHLYHDVLVAIDEGHRLNNGQPSLWARMYTQLELEPDADVVHVGAGTGYYSAILAEIVGRGGRVTALEIDAALAARASANLKEGWPQARVVSADGFAYRPERPADAIVVNAGVTHFPPVWLDGLAENGRLLVPLTERERRGLFLMVTRCGGSPVCYDARFAGRVGIIDCVGGRDPTAEARLLATLARVRGDFSAIRSLRRAPEEPDETCWLAGEGWWLSTAPLPREDTERT
jgi:protein-L-isoaspartate(D-aspartate) O-methyltransferase